MSTVEIQTGPAAATTPAAATATIWRWLPLAFAVTVVAVTLIAADTPPADLARFAAYAVLAVVLPGTLVFRALRRGGSAVR